ncbi:MAG: response regulator [Polyangiales bacterium]
MTPIPVTHTSRIVVLTHLHWSARSIRPAFAKVPLMAKILVVDDDEMVLSATARALQRAGHVVDATSDVFGLPIRVGSFMPDVVLLDYNLPALSGDQLAASLRKLRSARNCLVIFHSAEDESRLAAAVARTGAAGYVPKGLPRLDFLRRLRDLLENK